MAGSVCGLSSALIARMSRESKQLANDPPAGIACWQLNADSLTEYEAQLIGPTDSPYAGGSFHVSIHIPVRYPFEPPHVRFTTPIYHPNIDESGRICLDTLNMPPKGTWKPSVNLVGVLTSLQQLLSTPNPDDPLMQHIAAQYKTNYTAYVTAAQKSTQQHAAKQHATISANSSASSSEDLHNNNNDGAYMPVPGTDDRANTIVEVATTSHSTKRKETLSPSSNTNNKQLKT